MGEISYPDPVCAGDHLFMIAPCGKLTKAIRLGAEPTGVAAHAVAAGFIASISGNAIVAPTPFSTVRREMCFRKIIFSLRQIFDSGDSHPRRTTEARRHRATKFFFS